MVCAPSSFAHVAGIEPATFCVHGERSLYEQNGSGKPSAEKQTMATSYLPRIKG
jgi:hypothetical protein